MAGLYLHIPFCKKRCIYCDFYSTTREEMKRRYVEALCKELETRKGYLQGEPLTTIYLGGGTPSQLSPQELELIFNTIAYCFDLSKVEEITLEANPDDLTPDYVKGLRQLPINRLSMGIQSFDDGMLRLLNRRHTAQEAMEAVNRCQQAGLQRLSIDLMYGLPNQTEELWERDLAQALTLGVEHISAYHLSIEEGTPLHRLLQSHRVEEADEELSVRLFERLTTTLTAAGYQHYEISNFALPGCHSRHNSSYWEGVPYLGCGAAAHSFHGNSREWNVASIDRYIEGICQDRRNYEEEQLDLYTRYNERVMTALRTRHGLSLPQLKAEFGQELHNYCLRMARPHLLTGVLEQEGDTLRLSHQGILVSNDILSDLMFV